MVLSSSSTELLASLPDAFGEVTLHVVAADGTVLATHGPEAPPTLKVVAGSLEVSSARGARYSVHALGAQGWVAVCSNLIPKDSARLFELVADQGDRDQAHALYRRILPIVKWVGGHRYVAASKAGLAYMGLPVGSPRAPRLPLPEADTAALRACLDTLALKDSIQA